MIKSKIYVVEDMAMSRVALISMLEKNDFEVVGSAANANVAWDKIQNLEIDLILLDINLAGKQDGIWLATKVRENLNIAIVFLTAYSDDYTLNKMKLLNPNGYLLKPYNKPTLLTTLNIAIQSFNALKLMLSSDKHLSIIIEMSGKKIKIQLSKILYVQSDGNYIEIFLNNKSFIVRDKLSNFLSKLPVNDYLLQCHMRYIINKNHVEKIGRAHV